MDTTPEQPHRPETCQLSARKSIHGPWGRPVGTSHATSERLPVAQSAHHLFYDAKEVVKEAAFHMTIATALAVVDNAEFPGSRGLLQRRHPGKASLWRLASAAAPPALFLFPF